MKSSNSIILPPGAQLMESLRAVGYSLPAAIADIIDNSISADATNVFIEVNPYEVSPYLSILDDGHGISEDSAIHSMQLAYSSPELSRDENDLGRFGLGLKTASISQCRSLTLVTKFEGKISAFRWDLDHLEKTGAWELLQLSETEISGLPSVEMLRSLNSGTLVIWQKLDRLGEGSNGFADHVNEKILEVAEHLSLVFHRFMSGDAFTKVSIHLNGSELQPKDPFLTNVRSTQVSPRELLKVGVNEIAVQAYTLPFGSKLSAADRKRAGTDGVITLRDSQGFYIYRAGRLVIWGTWFRWMPKSELKKLTRIKVDIPNTLDHLWELDIKKSTAVPPKIVRDKLKNFAGSLAEPSVRAHRYRGSKETAGGVQRLWNSISEREGMFRYEINREHPLIQALAEELPGEQSRKDLSTLFSLIEQQFPSQDLYNRLAADEHIDKVMPDQEEILTQLFRLWLTYPNQSAGIESFFDVMRHVAPFDSLDFNDHNLRSFLTNGQDN